MPYQPKNHINIGEWLRHYMATEDWEKAGAFATYTAKDKEKLQKVLKERADLQNGPPDTSIRQKASHHSDLVSS